MKNKVKFEEYDGYTLGERRELTEKEKEAIQKESLKRIRRILDANGRSDVDERQFQIRLIKDRHTATPNEVMNMTAQIGKLETIEEGDGH